MKGVQCYELFRGMALTNHAFFNADIGSPVFAALSKCKTLYNISFYCNVMACRIVLRGFPCCTPKINHIKFSLAIGGVGEPYTNDTSLEISGNFMVHLHRRSSLHMELKAFLMSSFPSM